MNYQTTADGRQAGALCTGCDSPVSVNTGASIRTPSGRYAFACGTCTALASRSSVFRQQIEQAAQAGLSLRDVQRVFGKLGAAVPTTLEECLAALRLPPDAMADLVAACNER